MKLNGLTIDATGKVSGVRIKRWQRKRAKVIMRVEIKKSWQRALEQVAAETKERNI